MKHRWKVLDILGSRSVGLMTCKYMITDEISLKSFDLLVFHKKSLVHRSNAEVLLYVQFLSTRLGFGSIFLKKKQYNSLKFTC